MFKLIRQLFILLDPSQRKRFYMLQILVILSAFIEIFGILSIIPFMTVVGDMSLLKQDTFFSQLYNASGATSEFNFLFMLGIGVLGVLFLSALFCMFTTWRLSMFTGSVGTELSSRLYNYYIKKDWLFHTTISSSVLSKNIISEAGRVSNGILTPLMQMNSRILFAVFMSTSLFIYDPKVGIVGFIFFVVAYLILFKVVKNRIHANGQVISYVAEKRFRLINEGFEGIQDILLLGRDVDFIRRFIKLNKKLGYSLGNNMALALIPRYFMELLAFSIILILTLYLIGNNNTNLAIVLPIISVYALATLKLIPAFQQIYTCAATIKSNTTAFESVRSDLESSKNIKLEQSKFEKDDYTLMKKISLENVNFTYPGKSHPTLRNINISVPAKCIIGLVGKSGSGKSTLINILLGLLKPDQGYFKIDGKTINYKNIRSWQNTVGFVSQSIFLTDGTIADNIAFGVPKEEINMQQVEHVIQLAHLSEFVSNLEHGLKTNVGERGVQISGGQRQRIGIARALYNQSRVLIFDEATSSLDGITENMIMEAIHNLSGHKTIIMIAHRLKTVKKCDLIYFMDNGQVIDCGSYKDLVDRNDYFKHLASQS
jgi:HlyD family secretion protein